MPPRPEPPSPLRQRLATLERQLTEERAHHDRSRRQLEEARRVLAELQARAQRIALDHADDLTVERTASMRAQRELDDLVFERDRLAPMALPATTPAATRPEPVQPVLQPPASPAVADTPLPAPSGRQRQHTAPEPKPVRWWTASYRAGIKGKR